jgi:ankyrin repeat protein
VAVVELLVSHAPLALPARKLALSAQDRWGNTPLGDADRGGHAECALALRNAGAERSGVPRRGAGAEAQESEEEGGEEGEEGVAGNDAVVVSNAAPRMLLAAVANDVDELVKMTGEGLNMLEGDYDQRTALHLAASEGHEEAVRYILIQVESTHCAPTAH